MIKILFICHGNICRSPMAEAIFNHMVKEKGLEGEFFAASAAVSREEIGNLIYPLHRGSCGRKESPLLKEALFSLPLRTI